EEDGKTVYEIEFYKNGSEYEYTIDAISGTVLEYGIERDTGK
ncbi:MAG TPA: PepSY domain-containing protein, partial [Clostridiales bacterium]|nr:PepSY domain-containing protein [Clostridiales bacterium]